jgi:hypothetical protein
LLWRSLRQQLKNTYWSIEHFLVAVRDEREGTLNSLDFPEFSDCQGGSAAGFLVSGGIEALRNIAEYERRRVESAILELKDHIDPFFIHFVCLHINQTDLYGKMYLLSLVLELHRNQILIEYTTPSPIFPTCLGLVSYDERRMAAHCTTLVNCRRIGEHVKSF